MAKQWTKEAAMACRTKVQEGLAKSHKVIASEAAINEIREKFPQYSAASIRRQMTRQRGIMRGDYMPKRGY